MIAAVSVGAGREPLLMGKPSRVTAEVIAAAHPQLTPHRTLMVGDR